MSREMDEQREYQDEGAQEEEEEEIVPPGA